jgi:magnesium transporter
MSELDFTQTLRASMNGQGADVANQSASQPVDEKLVTLIGAMSAGERAALLKRLPSLSQAERDEATEDFHKGALISTPLGSLKNASVGLLYRKRVLWLVLLVFGNLFSGAGIAAFEETIAAHIALVFFLPLLVDSGGNAGAQSATLMVRALATGDVVMRDWLRLLGRECGVALGLGVTMSVAVAGLGLLRGGEAIAIVVASSMMIIVLIGSLVGMSLPFLLSRMRLDPATASGPLITSIADAAGVLVYFGIATLVLGL